MFVTTNMGLQAWDLGDDPYDHSELANNWTAIDTHDHSTGKGRQISEGGLANNAVTTAKIANGAVTPPKIPDASLTQAKLANNSVGSPQIIDGSVGTPELADHSVTSAKLDPSLYIIGEVIQWYRPNSSVSIPAGLEPCDGRPWSSIPNAWGVTTGYIPDMRNKFVLGAALSNNGSGPTQNPDIGQSGGSHTTDLTHDHAVTGPGLTVASHTHSISSDGSHTHSITVASVGDHTHGIFLGGNHSHDFSKNNGSGTGPLYTRALTTDVSSLVPTLHVTNAGAGTQALFHPGSDSDPTNLGTTQASIDMATAGDHNHTGATATGGSHTHTASSDTQGAHTHGGTTGGAASTTSAVSGTTDEQLGVLDKRPGYVGLIFLMRVL